MEIDPRRLRNCLGHFATGVTIVTCQADDGYHGVTVNAFMAVSLDPPLIQLSLDRRTKSCEYLVQRPFVVNVLADNQHDLALHFAGRPRDVEVPWRDDGDVPSLTGCIASISCTPWRTYGGGDHVLVLGEVEGIEFGEGDPLLFYLGEFRDVGAPLQGTPWIDSLDCPSGPGWFGPQHPSQRLARAG